MGIMSALWPCDMVVDSLISLSFVSSMVECQAHLSVCEFYFLIQSRPAILRFLLFFNRFE
jgi:hypothetical protein